MTALAMSDGAKNLSLKRIAKSEGISEKYLWNLVSPLKAAGLVASGRGPRGGYSLAKRAAAITLYDIVSILEGSLYPTGCVEDCSACKRATSCAAREVWQEVGEKIIETLKGVSLEEMANRQRRKLKSGAEAMYFI